MLAVVETIVLTTLVVVKADQVSLDGIFIVLLYHEHVRAEDYLVSFWDKCPLHKPVARFESNVDGRLEDEVVCQQTIRHSLEELSRTYSIAMIS